MCVCVCVCVCVRQTREDAESAEARTGLWRAQAMKRAEGAIVEIEAAMESRPFEGKLGARCDAVFGAGDKIRRTRAGLLERALTLSRKTAQIRLESERPELSVQNTARRARARRS